jgi:hypothetical protein
MILKTDLHIHSCLSPCAEADMTPCNIAAMAKLKGLDAIAVCDHNACCNARACAAAGERSGVLVVPGVEVTTAEELHALCYFPDIAPLEDFCALLESRQRFVPNRPELFGEQTVYGADDTPAGACPRWLGQPVELTLEQAEAEALGRGGVLVPAHIDRPSMGLLGVLGFIPPGLRARVMEVAGDTKLPPGYRSVRSSDAHSLGMLLEDGFPLDAGGRTARDIVDRLKGW